MSLNIEKSNFVLFHPRQRKIANDFQLHLDNKNLKQEKSIKYLGIYIDSCLSWKVHIDYIAKKIKKNVGILSKLRHYVDITVLINLYYALIYPFLIYGILVWGITYPTTLQPIYILQKKALRLISFSPFDAHSSPLFKSLNIIKFHDLVDYHISIFMFKYKHNTLPSTFENFFMPVNEVHRYNTRSAYKENFYLPKARTNYGKFNIKFQGPKIWNALPDCIKNSSFQQFKSKMKSKTLKEY